MTTLSNLALYTASALEIADSSAVNVVVCCALLSLAPLFVTSIANLGEISTLVAPPVEVPITFNCISVMPSSTIGSTSYMIVLPSITHSLMLGCFALGVVTYIIATTLVIGSS